MPYPYKSHRDWLAEEEELGNVLRIKEPIKCGDYSNLVDVEMAQYNPIDDPRGEMQGMIPETEMRAVARYLHTLPGKPIGIIENPIDNRPDIPVITNIWPNLERTLRGMGLKDKDELVHKMNEFKSNRIKPVVISKDKADCKEVIIPDDKVDLTKDIPRVWVEFNMLCFAGCNGTIISYDPVSNTHGLTKTRLGLFDWDKGDPNKPFPEEKVKRYGHATLARPGRLGQGNTGRYYFNNYRAHDKPWPAVYAYGLPNDFHVLAALKSVRWPEDGDEYEILSGMRGEPVELVESETIPGLMVPAQAEWVIEGEFVSEDYLTPTYSEDVGVGAVWGDALWSVFKVNCITHRKNPLWDATTFSSLGHEDHQGVHSGLYWAGINGDVLYRLRSLGFKVKDLTMHGMFTVVVQLEVDGINKPRPGYGEEVGKAVGAKYTIVVGPDIDIYNLEEVMWAVGMRADRGKWYELPKPPPTAPTPPKYGIMFELAEIGYQVIDATIPVPERFDTFPPRCEPPEWETKAIRRMKNKLE